MITTKNLSELIEKFRDLHGLNNFANMTPKLRGVWTVFGKHLANQLATRSDVVVMPQEMATACILAIHFCKEAAGKGQKAQFNHDLVFTLVPLIYSENFEQEWRGQKGDAVSEEE